MNWRELQDYALKFRLKAEYLPELQSFFETRCRDEFFTEAAQKFISDWPLDDVVKHYPLVAEQNKFTLLCAIANYPQVENYYHSHQFPEKMLQDIVGDLAVWVDTLYRDFGYPGLDAAHVGWTVACFTGNVKQFGRLQYNTVHYFVPQYSFYRQTDGSVKFYPYLAVDNAPRPDLSCMDKVLNIHIPALGALKRPDCIASLIEVTKFVAKFQPDYDYRAVVCYSWLLDPVFQELLPETSNIRQFQMLGHNYRWPDPDQTEVVKWRIWGDAGKSLPLDQLEQRNSIQKAVVNYLKSGGEFCEGGLIIWRDELPRLFEELKKC